MRPETLLPNYNECLVSISSSILKRFNIKDEHPSLKELDDIINNYKKTVLILFDGMGSYIVDKHLDKSSFLQKNKKRDLTSVFPPTTAAATTSLITCKNPNETGWLGWHMYFEHIDKDLVMFSNTGYYDNYSEENYSYKYLPNIDILNRIKDNNYRTKRINSFEGYESLDLFEKEIIDFCNKKEEGFMYAYHTEPDHLMHINGTNADVVHQQILNINDMVNDLYQKIDDDTLLIVTADHGHMDCDLINLYLDEDIKNNLKVRPYGDSRSIMFRVKDKDKFYKDFKHKYGGAFILLTKEEVLEMKLFGDKKDNPKFVELLGDFIAIGKDRYYMDYITNDGGSVKSAHSGCTKEEMVIPLILINK